MARIRSIKPEFWKSETIASLPFRDRLTFIGLWSYVDDNGVGIDSYKLISAELFGLEDDPREVRDNTRECLARLADARLITRYTLDGKRYIRITNWDEHQRIDRPNKPRYPLPTAEGVVPVDASQAAQMDYGTSTAGEDSRNPRATLASVHRLEQWSSGTGEQGNRGETHSAESPPTAAEPLWPENPVADAPERPKPKPSPAEFDQWWAVYPKKDAKGAARNAFARALKKTNLATLIAAAEKYRDDPERKRSAVRFTKNPTTWLNGECWTNEPTTGHQPASSGHQSYRNPDDNSIYEGAL